MGDSELQPADTGVAESEGFINDCSLHNRIGMLKNDVERHGESHVTFEHVDGEVEVRLGTSVFDWDGNVIRVYDGDQYHNFAMDKYVTHEVPMDVFH